MPTSRGELRSWELEANRDSPAESKASSPSCHWALNSELEAKSGILPHKMWHLPVAACSTVLAGIIDPKAFWIWQVILSRWPLALSWSPGRGSAPIFKIKMGWPSISRWITTYWGNPLVFFPSSCFSQGRALYSQTERCQKDQTTTFIHLAHTISGFICLVPAASSMSPIFPVFQQSWSHRDSLAEQPAGFAPSLNWLKSHSWAQRGTEPHGEAKPICQTLGRC